jgi:hypothetical protein
MIGLIRSLTILINRPERNSLREEPMLISCPRNLVFMGLFNTCCNANCGANLPMKIAAVIAINTQNVRLVNSFFICQK